MIIETKFFGPQEINESDIIVFNQGIPGFENFHRYVILQYKKDSMFMIMQSVDQGNLALVIIELAAVIPGYSIEITDEVVTELKLVKPEDATALAVVAIPAEVSKATVNLAAPIIINQQEHLAKQVILDLPASKLKHPLFAAQPVKEKVAAK